VSCGPSDDRPQSPDQGLCGRERRGGGGNRTRVLRFLDGPSPSASGGWISGSAPSPAPRRSPSQLSCPHPARWRGRSG